MGVDSVGSFDSHGEGVLSVVRSEGAPTCKVVIMLVIMKIRKV